MKTQIYFCGDCGQAFLRKEVVKKGELGNCLSCFGSLYEADDPEAELHQLKEYAMEAASDAFYEFQTEVMDNITALEKSIKETAANKKKRKEKQ